MEVVLAKNQNSELKKQGNREIEVKQSSLDPSEALNLVFGEYAANTQRAYARAFRDLLQWAKIKELDEESTKKFGRSSGSNSPREGPSKRISITFSNVAALA